MTNTLEDISSQMLMRAARLKERIEELQSQFDQIIGGYASGETGQGRLPQQAKKTFSASARRKMAASQKARWAKIKRGDSAKAESPMKPKRTMNAAWRNKIAAAAKARWAKAKAAGKNSL